MIRRAGHISVSAGEQGAAHSVANLVPKMKTATSVEVAVEFHIRG